MGVDAMINEVLPAPGFEGFEKRLEVEFSAASAACSSRGLRDMPREKIDELLTLAECTIVSQLSNELFDSYVLSESSLFIHPFKMVIKTCGTTALLKVSGSVATPYVLHMYIRFHIHIP